MTPPGNSRLSFTSSRNVLVAIVASLVRLVPKSPLAGATATVCSCCPATLPCASTSKVRTTRVPRCSLSLRTRARTCIEAVLMATIQAVGAWVTEILPSRSVGLAVSHPARMQNQKNPVSRSCFFFFASPPSVQDARNACAALKSNSLRELISFSLAPTEELFFKLDLQLVKRGVSKLPRLGIRQVFGHRLNDGDRRIFALRSFGGLIRFFDSA